MLQFQFKRPIQEVLSQLLLRVYPGIDKVWLIAEDPDAEEFNLYESNQQNEKTELINKVHIKQDNYLNSKNFYRWISIDETPLSSDNASRMQFNIFDEYKHRILHLYIPPIQHQMMVLYIFFNDQHAIGGARSDSRLSTEHKELVAHSIYHLLTYECERYQSDNHIAGQIQNMQKRIAAGGQTTVQDEFMQAYINEYLNQLGKDYRVSIHITDEAMDYLSSIQITPAKLKQLLNETVAWLMNFSSTDQGMTIERSHVYQEQKVSTNELHSNTRHDAKYNRSFELLEKLETAAQRVVQNGQRLTGVHVGQAFETAISAPAITDALRKHAQKIRTLMRLYPDRWLVIRSQFKPIQNVLDDDQNLATGDLQSA